MQRGCVVFLALYAAIAAAIYYYLSPNWDPPATWIGPLAAGLFLTMGLGGLWGARDALRDLRTLSRAISGAPLLDGRRAAAIGRVYPVGEPLLTPFYQRPCVCYEYDLRRPAQGDVSGAVMDAGLGGFRAEPYVVRSDRDTKVFGLPDFSEQAETICYGWEAYVRARELLERTEFRQMHGAAIGTLWKTLMEAWSDDDGSVDLHWQRVAGAGDWLNGQAVTDWLVASATVAEREAAEKSDTSPQQVDEEELDEDDEELDDDELDDAEDDEDGEPEDEAARIARHPPPLPKLVEKCLPVGEQVCLFGMFSAQHGAIAPSLKRHSVTIRALRGEPESVARQLRASVGTRLFAGMLLLSITAGALLLGTWGYRRSPQAQRARASELTQAVTNGDAAKLQRLLERATREEINEPDIPLLMQTSDAAIVRMLLDKGADPNRGYSNGETPLMRAAAGGNVEIARMLIDAGADLNLRDPRYNSTALVRALDAERDEMAALLRQSGALDDTVDERNGTAIDPTDSPPLAACVRYLEAIHAADADTLRALSATGRKASFDDVDWDGWSRVRPKGEVQVSGHAHDTAATIAITGETPAGYTTTWVFQLSAEQGEWKVLRERWLTKGLRA